MNAWLYPISRNSTHTFRDTKGKRKPVSVEAISEAVENGSFPPRAEWQCVQNGANVEPGDALYLYQGEIGIFVAGIIEDSRPSGRETEGGASTWIIEWRLDERRTLHLIGEPVPAEAVRKHVHPRVTVRNFTAGARALRRKLAL